MLENGGYTARSGNTVHLMVAAKPGYEHRAAVHGVWERKPSEEDKREFEQLFANRGICVKRASVDLTSRQNVEQVDREIKDFMGRPNE